MTRCSLALERGRDRGEPAGDREEGLQVQLFVTMLPRVSIDDMALVPLQARFCSHALAAARTGDDERAARLLESARKIQAQPGLTDEMRRILEAFYWPADAYRHYRLGDDAQAEAALLTALRCCQLLHESGYRLESHRIHLLCNVVRVRASAGRNLDACTLALATIEYLLGDATAWPLPDLQYSITPEPVDPELRLRFLDRLLAELARSDADDARRALDAAALSPAAVAAKLSTSPLDPTAAAVRLRLDAIGARGDGLARYLEHAVRVLEEGPAVMPSTWDATAGDIAQILREHTQP